MCLNSFGAFEGDNNISSGSDHTQNHRINSHKVDENLLRQSVPCIRRKVITNTSKEREGEWERERVREKRREGWGIESERFSATVYSDSIDKSKS